MGMDRYCGGMGHSRRAGYRVRRRQRRLSALWAPKERPSLPTQSLRWDEDTRRLGSLVALILLFGAAVLAVTHTAQLHEVERFEAAARPTTGTVIDPGLDGPLILEVNGQTREIDSTIEAYRQGETLPVLLDPGTGRISLVAEPDDPSWLLGWAAIAVVLSTCTWTALASRGQRRVDLLRNGGPAVELILLKGAFTVLADTSDTRRHELIIGHLLPIETAFVDDDREQPGPRRAFGRPPTAAVDHDEQPLPPDQLSDADVRDWANDHDEEDDGEPGLEIQPRPVTVIGHLVDGHPVLVRDGDNLLLSSRPIRDPWMFRRLLPHRSADSAVGGQSTAHDGLQGRRHRWPSGLSLPLALVLAVPAGLALWWLFNDPAVPFTWGDAIPFGGFALALATGLHRLAETGQAVLRAHPDGLRLRGPLMTTVLPAQRIAGIVTARGSIVLRLHDPSELLDVDVKTIANNPLTADDAATLVHHWLRQTGTTHTRWRHRPSPSLAPPALLLITLAASAALNLLRPQ